MPAAILKDTETGHHAKTFEESVDGKTHLYSIDLDLSGGHLLGVERFDRKDYKWRAIDATLTKEATIGSLCAKLYAADDPLTRPFTKCFTATTTSRSRRRSP